MKSKLILILSLALLLGTSTALAAPQTDYTAGKVSAHIDLFWSDVKASGGTIVTTFADKTNVDWGVTVGLGNRWAVQYEGFSVLGKNSYIPAFRVAGPGKFQHHELNALYKLTDNYTNGYSISAFAGITRDKALTALWSSSGATNWHVGVLGVKDINDDFKAYAQVGLGNKVLDWKIGLSYALDSNWDIDVFYRYYKVEKLSGIPGGSTDVRTKGFGAGVTYRFN